jgi:cell division septation protein DedD
MRAMTSSRRAAYARHELRFGTRELTVAALAVILVCGLAFAGGLMMGREMTTLRGGRAEEGSSRGAAPARPAPAPAAEAEAESPRSETRLTFYKTLTAPTVDTTTPHPPTIEERLVPKASPPGAPRAETRVAATPVAPPPAPPAVRGAPAPRVEAPPRPRTPVPPAPPAEPTAVTRSAAPGPAEPQLWTIQVSSFRTRALADDLRARLATRGFDAYLVSVATEEGRVRYRVRVGTFASRPEAERVTSELRSERSLSPFVTPKSR